jgi:hypothetical protein
MAKDYCLKRIVKPFDMRFLRHRPRKGKDREEEPMKIWRWRGDGLLAGDETDKRSLSKVPCLP